MFALFFFFIFYVLKIRRVEKELEYNFEKSKNNNRLIAGLSPRASVDIAPRHTPVFPGLIISELNLISLEKTKKIKTKIKASVDGRVEQG